MYNTYAPKKRVQHYLKIQVNENLRKITVAYIGLLMFVFILLKVGNWHEVRQRNGTL